MALFALASVACAFASSITMLLVFRALQGTTAGAGMVVGRAIVRDRFHGADAQRVMSQVSLTFALAPAVAPVIGGWLQAGFGWRAVFGFMVLYSGAIWFLCRAVLPETLPVERRQSLHPIYLLRAYWRVMTSVRFLAISVGGTLLFAGLFLYVASAPVFLMQHLGVSSTGFFWLFGPLTAGMALGAWTSGRSAGHLPARVTLQLAFTVLALTSLANFWFHTTHRPALPWSVVPLFFYSFGISLSFPTLTIRALDLFPAQRGLASSCQSFIQTGGAALTALLAPFAWSTTRSLAAAQLISVVAGLAAIFAYRLHRAPALAGAPTLAVDSEAGH
jgi:DHA1 family bicyclomycin/chloramphenicol resistance-like MFS transporter